MLTDYYCDLSLGRPAPHLSVIPRARSPPFSSRFLQEDEDYMEDFITTYTDALRKLLVDEMLIQILEILRGSVIVRTRITIVPSADIEVIEKADLVKTILMGPGPPSPAPPPSPPCGAGTSIPTCPPPSPPPPPPMTATNLLGAIMAEKGFGSIEVSGLDIQLLSPPSPTPPSPPSVDAPVVSIAPPPLAPFAVVPPDELPPPPSRSRRIGIIAGSTVGGAVVLVILLVFIVIMRRRSKNQRIGIANRGAPSVSSDNSHTEDPATPSRNIRAPLINDNSPGDT
jgi:hypothetical protein